MATFTDQLIDLIDFGFFKMKQSRAVACKHVRALTSGPRASLLVNGFSAKQDKPGLRLENQ